MAAFSSAGQLRRRPTPVNTSRRRARSGIGVSSEIDMGRSPKPAPNVIPHAQQRKVQPRRRLQSYAYVSNPQPPIARRPSPDEYSLVKRRGAGESPTDGSS